MIFLRKASHRSSIINNRKVSKFYYFRGSNNNLIMKKILLMLCCGLAASSAFAQKTTFGIKGGVNFASLSSSSSSTEGSYTTGTLTSFSVGVFADFKTESALSIQPAILYTGKGAKESGNISGTSYNVKANINYLQVPVNFLYNAPSRAGKFFVGAGPYAAFGLSAKVKASSGGQTESQDVEFGDGDDQYKRIDAGVTALVGFKFTQGALVSLNYDLGFTNISNQADNSTKTRVFGVSVGYAF
jgi:hypothetical protein